MKKSHILMLIIIFNNFIIYSEEHSSELSQDMRTFVPGPISFFDGDLAYVGTASHANTSPLVSIRRSMRAEEKTIDTQSAQVQPVLAGDFLVNYAEMNNPLKDQSLRFLSMLENIRPLFVTSQADTVYYQHSTAQTMPGGKFIPPLLIKSDSVNGALGAGQKTDILGLAWGLFYDPEKIEQEEKFSDYIFVPVKPHDGLFGDEGSGIAALKLKDELIEVLESAGQKNVSKKNQRVLFEHLDLVEGKKNGNKAYAFDRNHESVSIANGLASMELTNFIYNKSLNRFYFGFDITTKSDAENNMGGCALAMGCFHHEKFTIHPICSKNIMQSDAPFWATGPSKKVSIHHLKIMETSTLVPYLIFVGGQGNFDEATQKVYAYPLINGVDKQTEKNPKIKYEEIGRIASPTSMPLEYPDKNTNRLVERSFCRQAQENELWETEASMVGTDISLLPGTIEHLYVEGDSVFVVIKDKDISKIFYSQAILNSKGAIGAWTPWKISIKTTKHLVDAYYDKKKATWSFLEKTDEGLYLHRSEWYIAHGGNEGFFGFVHDFFMRENKGIYGLFEFDNSMANVEDHIAVMLGNKKLLMAHMCADHNFMLTKALNIDEENVQKGISVYTLDKGPIEKLGILTSCAVIHDKDRSWLLVGGIGGLGLFHKKNKNSVAGDEGLLSFFKSDAAQVINLHIFDAIKGVRKIFQHQEYVYILTLQALYKISAADLIENKIKHMQEFPNKLFGGGMFNDCIPLNNSLLIGTTRGLFQSLCDNPCAYQKLLDTVPITKIRVIESPVSSIRNIYVLSADTGKQKSEIYRFITDNDTITTALDFKRRGYRGIALKEQDALFGALLLFRSSFYLNGAMIIAPAGGEYPFIDSGLFENFVNKSILGNTFSLKNLNGLKTATIGGIELLSSLGLVIYGDFGIGIHL